MWDKKGQEFNPRPLRNRAHVSYALMESAESSMGEEKWTSFLEKCRRKDLFSPHQLQVVRGSKVTTERLCYQFSEPFVVLDPPETLDMHLPPELTCEMVAELIGSDRPLSVIDVASQGEISMTLGEWTKALQSQYRPQIFNLISLEFSGTPLAQHVVRPRAVRDVDLVDLHWPFHRTVNHDIPCVKLYCLMSMAKSWTDFHIDMGGTSVFYHIVRGSKTFYFIRPTTANLAIYNTWMSSDTDDGLMRLVDETWEVQATAGQTLFIPSGWIHAVFTPSDSLVIGGNFLHARAIDIQLQIHSMEKKSGVGDKFLFPCFTDVQWYTATHYASVLESRPDRIDIPLAEQLLHLAAFLFDNNFARTAVAGASSSKSAVSELIKCAPPSDLARDPFVVVTMLTLGSLKVLNAWQQQVPVQIKTTIQQIVSMSSPQPRAFIGTGSHSNSPLPPPPPPVSSAKKRAYPQYLGHGEASRPAPSPPPQVLDATAKTSANPRAQLPVQETALRLFLHTQSNLASQGERHLTRPDAPPHVHPPAQVRQLVKREAGEDGSNDASA
ncbi:hypothetical protein BCR44DRAFT_73812 [Catenaria anguillulae PL171]|uniref:[histone H3]-dimethyl-L-lysine(36) demethylase n=1 Tax=Catenaria anguillulae PL171 TaxID=765915 RepID=A0A1Y2HB35_9FUNG|nr:hypothetical protein BCR44DRAFT_73812 [Catenaria anguillulae PL171]